MSNLTLHPKEKQKLDNMRIIKRNLVYVIGIDGKIANKELLVKKEYFGQYGKITKLVVNKNGYNVPNNSTTNNSNGLSYSAYISYSNSQEASLAILSIDSTIFKGRQLKAAFGTTKYCTYFLKKIACPNKDCLYTHSVKDKNDVVSKETNEYYNDQHKEAVKLCNLNDPKTKAMLNKIKDDDSELPNPYNLYNKRNIIGKDYNNDYNYENYNNNNSYNNYNKNYYTNNNYNNYYNNRNNNNYYNTKIVEASDEKSNKKNYEEDKKVISKIILVENNNTTIISETPNLKNDNNNSDSIAEKTNENINKSNINNNNNELENKSNNEKNTLIDNKSERSTNCDSIQKETINSTCNNINKENETEYNISNLNNLNSNTLNKKTNKNFNDLFICYNKSKFNFYDENSDEEENIMNDELDNENILLSEYYKRFNIINKVDGKNLLENNSIKDIINYRQQYIEKNA